MATANAPYPCEIAESMAWAKRVLSHPDAGTSERLLARALVEALTELKRTRSALRAYKADTPIRAER